MESRRGYEQRFELLLKVWGARLEALAEEHRRLPGDRQRNGELVVERARERMETSKRMLVALAMADDERWGDLRRRADTTWYWLRHSIEDVKSVIELARDGDALAPSRRRVA